MGWERSLRGLAAGGGLLEEGLRNPNLESARVRGTVRAVVLARWPLCEPSGAAQTRCWSLAPSSGTGLPGGQSLPVLLKISLCHSGAGDAQLPSQVSPDCSVPRGLGLPNIGTSRLLVMRRCEPASSQYFKCCISETVLSFQCNIYHNLMYLFLISSMPIIKKNPQS